MPEKLRFEGTPVVLLLVFGESLRAAMGWNNGSARLKNLDYFDSYHRRAVAAGIQFASGLNWPGDHGGSGAEKELSFGSLRRR
ncbi:hypothetical protein [Bradyrhizobium lablabi]|uniref:hypothetical protein n=1 Tax=Bradyrhizobium lablabi TaxID=722472 RepID=UPI001560A4BB|nr:hypothetical protein [Bradyrhizobium lablabi]